MIWNYKIGTGVANIKEDALKNIYMIADKKILVVDSLGIYNSKNITADYVLLMNSPKINLNRLLNVLHPKIIIADGSNYKSYIERWKTACKEREITFHQTRVDGAFIVKN